MRRIRDVLWGLVVVFLSFASEGRGESEILQVKSQEKQRPKHKQPRKKPAKRAPVPKPKKENPQHWVSTVKRDLVLPIVYFENLCFDARKGAFLSTNPGEFAPGRMRSWERGAWQFAIADEEELFRLAPSSVLLHPQEIEWEESLPLVHFEEICTPMNITNSHYLTGTTFFLFETKQTGFFLFDFFHLLEHVVGLWSFYGDAHSEDVRLIVLASDGDVRRPAAWRGQNGIHAHLLQALFPLAKVQTWGEFVASHRGHLVCMERAVTSDRALALDSAECVETEQMLGMARAALSREALDRLSSKVRAYAGVCRTSSHALRVTYLKSPFPRTLSQEVEVPLLGVIRSLPYVYLTVADLTYMPFSEQMALFANTDVLVGVYGSGLSHLVFLPEGASVIEFFAKDSHRLDNRLLAGARGLHYFGVISNQGVLYDEEAYRGPFGAANTTIRELDIEEFVSILSILPSL